MLGDKRGEHGPATANAIIRLLLRLRAQWPAAFCWPPVPLEIGIGDKLAPELYPSEWNLAYFSFWQTKPGVTLRDAMHRWTHSQEYLAACTPGAERVNLDGVAVGTVSEADAAWAASELQRLRNFQQSRRPLISNAPIEITQEQEKDDET